MNKDDILYEISQITNYRYTKDTSREVRLLVNELMIENLVERNSNNKNYFQLTKLGYKALDAGYNNLKEELRSDREFQKEKEQIDFDLAKKTLEEFPQTKKFARISLGITIVLAIVQITQ